MAINLNAELSKKTDVFGLKVWVLIGIVVGVFIVAILTVLSLCATSKKKSKRASDKLPVSIPTISKEIKEVRIDQVRIHEAGNGKCGDKESDTLLVHLGVKNGDNGSQSGSFHLAEKELVGSQSGDYGSGTFSVHRNSASYNATAPSPLSGLPEFSHLGWGHWFTLRDLELATDRFSKENILGEGGYGVVYRGQLINGTHVGVKKLLNNLGQAEKEFGVEVEAIGHVRHKNLVRLLGYCVEGTHRMLVYEYVNNGNLEQWLHGGMLQHGYLTWEARMKVLQGTAKALAYLHEAIEPKVLGQVISPLELWEPLDMLLRNYGRAANEVNLVDWLKMMVGSRRSEEVVDPNIERKPSTRALKRALLTALRCVDPDSQKRPKMSQVVRMLESEEYPIPREGRRRRKSQTESIDTESLRENSDTDKSDNPDSRAESKRNYRV
ncbi:hypothetical protein MKX03_030831 [Papaver bracteatum]|nr:hypothetical protein MKX03_030831 [Papaver bracteatum]